MAHPCSGPVPPLSPLPRRRAPCPTRQAPCAPCPAPQSPLLHPAPQAPCASCPALPPAAQAANARDLCCHVRSVMMYRHDAHTTTGPASAVYTAFNTYRAVEATLMLLAERMGYFGMRMNRRSAATGATGECVLALKSTAVMRQRVQRVSVY